MSKAPAITTIAEFPHPDGKFTVVIQKRGGDIYYNARLADPGDKETFANLEDDLRACKQRDLIPLITEAEEQLSHAVTHKKKRRGYADHIAALMSKSHRASEWELQELPDGLWCMMRHPVHVDRNRSGGTIKSYLSQIAELTGIKIPVEETAAKITTQYNIPETLHEVSSPDSPYTLIVRQQGPDIVYSIKAKAADNAAALQTLAEKFSNAVFLPNGALWVAQHPASLAERGDTVANQLAAIAQETKIEIPAGAAEEIAARCLAIKPAGPAPYPGAH